MGRARARFAIPALRLGISLLAVMALPCEVHGQAQTTLRWKFPKGERLHLSVNVDETQDMTPLVPAPPPGLGDLKSTVSTTVEYTWSVEEVAGDGSARISLALRRARIAVKAPGGEISEDTKTGPRAGSESSKSLQNSIGRTLTFRMTPLGEVEDITLSDPLQKSIDGARACGPFEDILKESLRWAALVLPREPVEAGTQWKRRVEKPEPGLLHKTQELIYTYKGPSDAPQRERHLIDVASKLEIKADPQGIYRMDLRYKSQDGRGTVVFDGAVGHLLSVDFTQKAELGMTLLGKESVSPSERHVKLKLDREDGPRPEE